MRITVLSDNIGDGELKGEWGLSLHIEYRDRQYLLDTGASDLFMTNALKSGIDIKEIDAAVMSHAHYDHTGGIAAFLRTNSSAPVYLSPEAGENCYAGCRFIGKYIGIPKGALSEFQGRILRPYGVTAISEGVTIVPHSTPGLEKLGRRNHLYRKRGHLFYPDNFSHEQTLVFRTGSTLAVMSSCSHSGPDVIIGEVQEVFPYCRISAYIGGLHLFRLTDSEVEAVADRLDSCGIDHIYTGHCTGHKAFGILKKRFGDRIVQFKCGMRIEL